MDVFLLIVLSVSHAIAVSFLKWLVKIKLVLKMHRKKHSVPFRCASPSCFGTEEQVLYECHLTHSHICSHQQLYVCTSIEPRLKLTLPACTPRLKVFLCWPANFLFHRVSSVFLWGRQPPRELNTWERSTLRTGLMASPVSLRRKQSDQLKIWQELEREKKEARRHFLSTKMDRYPFHSNVWECKCVANPVAID